MIGGRFGREGRREGGREGEFSAGFSLRRRQDIPLFISILTHLYVSSPPSLPPSLRREFGTDEILDEPQPFFDLIKECYPSWYCGQGKNGDPVYWER